MLLQNCRLVVGGIMRPSNASDDSGRDLLRIMLLGLRFRGSFYPEVFKHPGPMAVHNEAHIQVANSLGLREC
jgi:hypothetical protein